MTMQPSDPRTRVDIKSFKARGLRQCGDERSDAENHAERAETERAFVGEQKPDGDLEGGGLHVEKPVKRHPFRVVQTARPNWPW